MLHTQPSSAGRGWSADAGTSEGNIPIADKELRSDRPQEGRTFRYQTGVLIAGLLRVQSSARVTVCASPPTCCTPPSDRHLWAESYEGDLGNVLELQGEVARAITNQIRIKVTPQEQVRLASARPINTDAYATYLKGRFFLSQDAFHIAGDARTREGLDTALEYFQLALKKDPNYAPGYVAISLIWQRRGGLHFGWGK